MLKYSKNCFKFKNGLSLSISIFFCFLVSNKYHFFALLTYMINLAKGKQYYSATKKEFRWKGMLILWYGCSQIFGATHNSNNPHTYTDQILATKSTGAENECEICPTLYTCFSCLNSFLYDNVYIFDPEKNNTVVCHLCCNEDIIAIFGLDMNNVSKKMNLHSGNNEEDNGTLDEPKHDQNASISLTNRVEDPSFTLEQPKAICNSDVGFWNVVSVTDVDSYQHPHLLDYNKNTSDDCNFAKNQINENSNLSSSSIALPNSLVAHKRKSTEDIAYTAGIAKQVRHKCLQTDSNLPFVELVNNSQSFHRQELANTNESESFPTKLQKLKDYIDSLERSLAFYAIIPPQDIKTIDYSADHIKAHSYTRNMKKITDEYKTHFEAKLEDNFGLNIKAFKYRNYLLCLKLTETYKNDNTDADAKLIKSQVNLFEYKECQISFAEAACNITKQEQGDSLKIVTKLIDFYSVRTFRDATAIILKLEILELMPDFQELPLFLDLIRSASLDGRRDLLTEKVKVLYLFWDYTCKNFCYDNNDKIKVKGTFDKCEFVSIARLYILRYLQLEGRNKRSLIFYSHAMVMKRKENLSHAESKSLDTILYFAFIVRKIEVIHNHPYFHGQIAAGGDILVFYAQDNNGLPLNLFSLDSICKNKEIVRTILEKIYRYITRYLYGCGYGQENLHNMFYACSDSDIIIVKRLSDLSEKYEYEIYSVESAVMHCMKTYKELVKSYHSNI